MTKRETYISRQARRLSQGQIDRRRFVMSALATGVTMPTAMSLASRAEAAAPKFGGHLRFGVHRTEGSEAMQRLRQACGSTLVSQKRDGGLAGDLAEDFGSDDTGRIWTFTLRPDIQFHSGKKVTPQDVVASYHAAAHQDATAQAILSLVSSLEANTRSVRVTLHKPHFDFPRLLATPQLAIFASEDGQAEVNLLDGSGLYQMVSHQSDGAVLLKRNPNHWNSSCGHFETVELLPFPDVRARQSAIMTGEVDVVDAVDPRAPAMLSTLPDIQVTELHGPRHLALDVHHPDDRIKSALRAALDRNALLDRAQLGHGAIGDDIPIRRNETIHMHDPHLAQHIVTSICSGSIALAVDATSIRNAESLISHINHGTADTGLSLHLAAAGEPVSVTLREVLGHACEETSFCLPQASDLSKVWSDTSAGRKFASLIEKSRSSKTLENRKAALSAARAILRSEGNRIIPLWSNDLLAHSNRLLPHPGSSATSDVITRWWFA